MLFTKKKRMIDVRELQKKGFIIPKEEVDLMTDKEGFVDLNSQKNSPKPVAGSNKYFSFMNKEANIVKQSPFGTESEGYNKREVDAKITDMDNKIYKLEQRIELLERKVGVNQPTGNSLIGW